MSIIITLILGIFLMLFPAYVATVFTDDLLLINGSVKLMPLLFIILMICSISTVYFNALTGTGATRVALIIVVISTIFYLFYAYSVVNLFNWDLPWVWAAELLYWLMVWVMAHWYISSGRWKELEV